MSPKLWVQLLTTVSAFCCNIGFTQPISPQPIGTPSDMNISNKLVVIGSTTDAGAKQASGALARNKIHCGINADRNVASLSVTVKDEARAVDIVSKDAAANNYGLAISLPPHQYPSHLGGPCELLATLSRSSSVLAIKALRSVGIQCAESTTGEESHLWI